MTTLLLIALIVSLALLAPAFGADSRDLPGGGNRGDHPTGSDPVDPCTR